MMRSHPVLHTFWLLLLAFPTLAEGKSPFSKLKYRSIGPAIGGRVSRAVGVPGDPLTYYFAASMGGVWKSSDGGLNWKPIFDKQPVSSIGSIAVAHSDANVIYVGSGEANPRGNVASGNGIYKSTDAGKTWKHVWKSKGQIGTMIVHPKNADIAYAAVFGRIFGQGENRGVYRTTDGGKSWKKVLYVNEDTGCSDVCFDPSNPQILFAGFWQARRKPWDLISGGPGSGLFTSRDGGDTWTQLIAKPKDKDDDAPKGKKYSKGLPKGIWGKVAVRVAPSDSQRVYALIEAEDGGLFRSDDGGDTWAHINDHRALRQRAWYFSHLTIHPTNADVIYCPQVPLLKSIDGGRTFQRVKGTHHGDHHDIWIDPTNPKRIIDSNDGGVDITTNGGKTWYAPPLPICQFYHIEVDSRTPYHVMGTIQDIGTASGPSDSLTSSGIHVSHWKRVGGGEAGHIAPDRSDPNIVYAGEYGGYISRFDLRTKQAQSISIYPYNPSGHDPKNLQYRFQWTAPILVSPHDSKVVYHAANVLFRTKDGGKSWEKISPDLTRDDKSKQQWAGGPITGDNTGVEVYCTIFAIGESPLKKGLLWAGSDDGLVHASLDDGKTWKNITKEIPDMPDWGTVRCIEPSPFDENAAYIVVDRHRLDDTKPYLWKVSKEGVKKITNGLPKEVYLHVVRADPNKKGMLYLGTEKGVYFSRDDGEHWQPLKLNMPTVAVTDLKVKDNDLVVGTNGRAIWILDDLTPIRQWSEELPKQNVHFFKPQSTMRTRRHSTPESMFHHATGENPPAGAILHYHLKQRPKKQELKLDILDKAGNVIRKLDSKVEVIKKPVHDEGAYSDSKPKKTVLPVSPGLHRVIWDLHYEGAKMIKNAKVDMGSPEVGPLVNPGTYTLRLNVDGKIHEQTLEVRLDPRLKNKSEELSKQLKVTLELRDNITRLAEAVNQLRSVKTQIETRAQLLADRKNMEPLLDHGKQLVKEFDKLEEQFHNPRAKVAYDILAQRGGAKLYSQLTWLYTLINSSDGEPNQGLLTLKDRQESELAKLVAQWDGLLENEVQKYNDMANKLKVPGVIIPKGSKIK